MWRGMWRGEGISLFNVALCFHHHSSVPAPTPLCPALPRCRALPFPALAAVVRQLGHLHFEALPVTEDRPEEFSKPAAAAAAFDAPQVVSGSVRR